MDIEKKNHINKYVQVMVKIKLKECIREMIRELCKLIYQTNFIYIYFKN